MRNRGDTGGFNIALLDILSGALGAVIILYMTVPKANEKVPRPTQQPPPVCTPCPSPTPCPTPSATPTPKPTPAPTAKPVKAKAGKDVDVGFKFNGHNVVFLIDVSGSMKKNDKIGQVKAGIKMLITSMSEDFKVDVLIFPNGEKSLYRSLFGRLKPTNTLNKLDVYDFLFNIRAYGATPTRAALFHVLDNYPLVTDIVLLSDGAPTKGNTREFEDIFILLTDLRKRNFRRTAIHTIGVGQAFIGEGKSDAFIFLKNIAKESGGFFVGF